MKRVRGGEGGMTGRAGAPEIRSRHDAALTTGGGRLPVSIRAELASRRPRRGSSRQTRVGKRVPRRAKRAAARAGKPGRARD